MQYESTRSKFKFCWIAGCDIVSQQILDTIQFRDRLTMEIGLVEAVSGVAFDMMKNSLGVRDRQGIYDVIEDDLRIFLAVSFISSEAFRQLRAISVAEPHVVYHSIPTSNHNFECNNHLLVF